MGFLTWTIILVTISLMELMGKLRRHLSCMVLFLLIHGVYSANDPLEPHGNITVMWDILAWTEDGYNALVTLWNYQQYRHVEYPGWRLGWNWRGKEFIWDVVGAEATEQGDCSSFKGYNIPHCCSRDPIMVDLESSASDKVEIANCCRGGILSSTVQDPENSEAAFRMKVGIRGMSSKNTIVGVPSNFTLEGPGSVYSCSRALQVEPAHFEAPGGRRQTQAMKSWRITCKYSQVLSHKRPVCCVSFSAFYNETITPCPVCSCGCHDPSTHHSKACFRKTPSIPTMNNNYTSINNMEVQCTRHMCPIRVHWHVMASYIGYWRAKITIMNFGYQKNYTDWNLVIQHPTFNSLQRVFSFNHTSLTHNKFKNDTAMFWGIKYFNDILMQSGDQMGSVQSEILLQKMEGQFSFSNGWAFPHRVYFNGDECILPLPDAYPWLPSSTTSERILSGPLFIATLLSGSLFFYYLYHTCTVQR